MTEESELTSPALNDGRAVDEAGPIVSTLFIQFPSKRRLSLLRSELCVARVFESCVNIIERLCKKTVGDWGCIEWVYLDCTCVMIYRHAISDSKKLAQFVAMWPQI